MRLPEAAVRATRDASPTADKFAEVVEFVKPFQEFKTLAAVPPTLTAEQLAELLDFHDGVALAADYPALLRALGLVVDLEFDPPANLPAEGLVSVTVGGLAGEFLCLYPLHTHYTLAGGHFLPAPRPVGVGQQPETRDGMLRLSDEDQYRIVQTDVVGGALKVQNAATNIMAQKVAGIQSTDPPADETLTALRSAGLAVVQRDLAGKLYAA